MKKTIFIILILIIINSAAFFFLSKDTEGDLQKYIDQAKSEGKVKDVAVFVKLLDTGKSYGVNENEVFIPSSMFKVPIMMGILKEAESNPDILTRRLPFSAAQAKVYEDIEQYPIVTRPMYAGQSYTVFDLINRMIQESDNNALQVLNDNIPNKFNEVMKGIGLIPRSDLKVGGVQHISPKVFSRVFEELYSPKYLIKKSANVAIEILKETSFVTGLQAGVAEGIEVAHKFGVSDLSDTAIEIGVNDCGIVFSKKPYSICVMTTGNSVPNQEEVIKNISAIVYKNLK